MLFQGHRFWMILSTFGCLCVAFALAGVALVYGNLNHDEGWYLYAAQRVHEQVWPYRDFFFTQGPVMPVVYGALADIWSPLGVVGGRLMTLCFGMSGAVLTAFLAYRLAGKERGGIAALVAFSLIACNLYHVYFTTIPKTYGLAFFLIMAGYVCLTLPMQQTCSRNKQLLGALAGGFLLALATGTRVSMGLLLAVTGVAFLATWRSTRFTFFWFGLGGIIGLALVYAPPLIYAHDNFIFAQTFHTSRNGHDLLFMAGSISRSVRFYLPIFTLLGAIVSLHLVLRTPEKKAYTELRAWPLVWVFSSLAVFLFQLMSPYPYDDYQVPVMGLLAAATAVWTAQLLPLQRLGPCCFALCLFSWLSAFGSPLLQEWMVIGQDRFWVVKKTTSDLQRLKQAARTVNACAKGDAYLLTQDTYLAVEAGKKVPPGFEMGPFSYFPELTDEEAQRYHVLNKARLLTVLQQAPTQVAALSGYTFAVRSPIMDEVPAEDQAMFDAIIAKHYDLLEQIPHFGQNYTPLRVYVRRAAEHAPKSCGASCTSR